MPSTRKCLRSRRHVAESELKLDPATEELEEHVHPIVSRHPVEQGDVAAK
jgi:hypothetical protein